MTDVVLLIVTTPTAEKAADIGRILVEEKLAACTNIIAGVRSIYSWQGKLCDDAEALMIIKTTRVLFEQLRDRVVALHPYECPEILQLGVEAGHTPYLEWLRANVRATVSI